MRVLRLVTVLLALAALPAPASAQFEWVGSLLGRITDLGVFRTLGDVTPAWDGSAGEATGAPHGLGVELLFAIKPWTRATGPARDTVIYVPVEVDVTRAGRQVRDSVTTYRIERRTLQSQRTIMLLELAVGYAENTFTIRSPDFTVRGALRELPMLTVYGSLEWDAIAFLHDVFTGCGDDCGIENVGLSPYVGLRGGLVSLSGMRAFVTVPPDGPGTPVVRSIRGSGDAFRGGFVGGLVLGIGPANIYVEAEHGRRRIPSVQWEADIPASLPQNLQFRRWMFTTGLQLEVGRLAGGGE